MKSACLRKLILEGSDTSVAIFNPFGFREDYGGKDMIPIEEQVEVRNRWPDRSVMLGGGLTPNQGLSETLERLHMSRRIRSPAQCGGHHRQTACGDSAAPADRPRTSWISTTLLGAGMPTANDTLDRKS